MTPDCDLNSLLVRLADLNQGAIEQMGRDLYRDLYLNKGEFGVHQTHDNQVIIFHGDAFEHAFYTSSDWRCHPERKDILRTSSIERIRWIGYLISGQVPGSACFEVPSKTGRYHPPNRVYAFFDDPYVVWLEPRKAGGWKFRTAYPIIGTQIHSCTRGGRTVWRWKEKGPMIKPAHGATSHVQTD